MLGAVSLWETGKWAEICPEIIDLGSISRDLLNPSGEPAPRACSRGVGILHSAPRGPAIPLRSWAQVHEIFYFRLYFKIMTIVMEAKLLLAGRREIHILRGLAVTLVRDEA